MCHGSAALAGSSKSCAAMCFVTNPICTASSAAMSDKLGNSSVQELGGLFSVRHSAVGPNLLAAEDNHHMYSAKACFWRSPCGVMQEPPGWDNSAKGHRRANGGVSQRQSRGSQHHESLLELKERVMARLQQVLLHTYPCLTRRSSSPAS